MLLSLVLGPAVFPERDQEALLEAFLAIQAGYDQDRRRLGTPGVLHPLRAAAILAPVLSRSVRTGCATPAVAASTSTSAMRTRPHSRSRASSRR